MEDATRIQYATEGLVLRSITSGTEHPLHGEMLVGREVECAITLGSSQASRYHAKINVSANGVYIEDLHSTNGTYINGQKARGRIRLSIGDEISFDNIAFRLASAKSGDEDATALAPRNITQTVPKRLKTSTNSDSKIDETPKPISHPELKPELASKAEGSPRAAAPVAAVPYSAKPQPVTSAEWAPEKIELDLDADDSNNTQMISATHMNRLIERNRNDVNVNIGSGPRLIIMTAPLRGKVFSVEEVEEGTRWFIGRSDESNIRINDKTISMDHARISKTSKGFVLTATHARNGIIVNGQNQKQTILNHNDKIQIGRTELLFRTDDSPQSEFDVEAMPYEELRNHKFTIISTLAIIAVIIIAVVTTAK